MTNHRRMAFTVLAAAVLALPFSTGCGKKSHGGGSPTPSSNGTLVFAVQPSDAASGAVIAPPITVEIRDLSNVLIATATDTVTLAFQLNPGGATLSGTLSRAAVGGTATFDDITLDAPGTGYALRASATGFTSGVSSAFNIASTGATQVVVTTQPPATVAPYQAFTVEVELRDAGGFVDTGYNGPVTLAFGAQPAGNLIVHASGLGTPIIELIDTSGPAVVGTITPTVDLTEVTSMVYDPSIRLLRVTDWDFAFSLLDPATGDVVRYGNDFSLSNPYKGIAFNGMGDIRALSRFSDQVATIDLITGIDSDLGTTLTLTSYTIGGSNGLSRHPTSGLFYAILNPGTFSPDPRVLVTVNMGSGVCTLMGDTGEAVAGITFAEDGTLYAVTGDGSNTPSTLWTVDITNGALTSLLTLGNGDDGESIAYVPRRLSGTLTVNAINGVATFSGLSIDQLGTGYTLTITSGGLTPDTTSAIDVSGAVSPTATVEFSAATSSVAENVGGGLATITLQLSAAQAHNMPVMIFIDPTSSATGIEDHNQPYAFEVTVPAGQTTVNFTIPIVDDAIAEADETVILTIASANLSAGIGATATHTLTITNDD